MDASQAPADESSTGDNAPHRAPSPEEAVEDAEAHLQALDDEGARLLAQPFMDDPTVDAALRARAARVVGIAESHLKHPDAARTAFRAALAAQPDLTLPENSTEATSQLFVEAQAQQRAARPAPAPLPPKIQPDRPPALGWMRPTSILVMASGGVFLGVGALVAVLAVGVREYARWVSETDPVVGADIGRALLPMALFAGFIIVLSVPVAGTGLALFFLSGKDGPLQDRPLEQN